MALLLQVLVTGLAAGAVYGLAAIGIALLYRLTGVLHFALGELVGLSVFVTLAVAGGTGPVTRAGVAPGRFLLALALGALVAVLGGLLSYAVAVRPFLSRDWTLGWIGGLLALAFAVRASVGAAFARPTYVFPDPLGLHRLADGGVIRLGGGVTLQVRAFVVLGVAAALAAVAAWLLGRTDTGRALRAIADDRTGARAVGLPVELLLGGAFATAGVLAALAAVAQAPAAPVSADTGALLGLKGLVAALLSGFGSPWRAFAAGIVLGLVETGVAAIGFLGAEYRDVLPLALVLLALAARRAARVPGAA